MELRFPHIRPAQPQKGRRDVLPAMVMFLVAVAFFLGVGVGALGGGLL